VIKQFLAASLVILMSSTASAALVSFDFTGGPTQIGDPLSFSEGGYELIVTGTPGVAVDTDFGLGVRSRLLFDSNQVDGAGPDETISFSFAQNVRLVSVIFGAVGFDDDFTLALNGVVLGSADIPNGNVFDFTQFDLSGTSFGFGVAGSNDDYYISGLTVDVAAPSVIALFGLALAAIGFSRRKAKA
jgi:hypothetical protein